MRDNLTQYVNLLFAGASGAEDIRQEILQNTLDRYDDLISQGKSPEAAYRLAISGIGDISEILGTPAAAPSAALRPVIRVSVPEETDGPGKKLGRAAAIGLYILSPLPLFILSEFGMATIGFCGCLTLAAAATVILLLCKSQKEEHVHTGANPKEESELMKSISSLIWALGLAAYLLLSFATGAWHLTWLVFPITGSLRGLIKAIIDLCKEV